MSCRISQKVNKGLEIVFSTTTLPELISKGRFHKLINEFSDTPANAFDDRLVPCQIIKSNC